MRLRLLSPLLLILLLLTGCSGSKDPPTPRVTADKVLIPTVLGSHCWQYGRTGRCADSPSPPELLVAVKYQPPVIPAGATLQISFPTAPTEPPTISRWDGDQAETQGFTVTVPDTPGIYTYDIAARWEQGSASYAFQVEAR